MNKLLAVLFGLGSMGAFALSQLNTFQTQQVDYFGEPFGPIETVYNSRPEKIGFLVFGSIFMIAALVFIIRSRRDDLR